MENFNDIEYLRRDFLKNDYKLLILSITKRCNLRCLYCRGANEWYDVLSKNSQSLDFNKNEWHTLVDFCEKNKILEVLLTGGEPIEYPFIEEFLSFLKSNNIRFSIHTNGSSKKWEGLLQHLIEIDLKPNIAMSVELYDDLQQEVRGCDIPYDLIDKMIQNEFNIEFKVTLHQKLLKYLDSIEEKLKFWHRRGVKSIKFQPVEPVGNGFEESLKLDKKFASFIELLLKFKASNHDLESFIRNSCESFETIKSLIENGYVDESVPEQCITHKKILFLNTDNKVLNCKSLWNRENTPCRSDTFSYVCCGYKS